MLLNELTPLLKELTKEPAAFCSGFISGALRLNLTDDPVKSWLEKQAGFTPTGTNDRQRPQSIDIDQIVNEQIYLVGFVKSPANPQLPKKVPELVIWTTQKTQQIGYDEKNNYQFSSIVDRH